MSSFQGKAVDRSFVEDGSTGSPPQKRQRCDFVNPYLDLEAVMDVGGDEEEDVAADDNDIFIDQGMFYYNSTQ